MYSSNIKFGELLIKSGKISNTQLEDALNKQKNSNHYIGELLMKDGLITEEDIINTLSTQFNICTIKLNDIDIEKTAISLVPEQIASKNTLVPIAVKGDRIIIAIYDPLNIFAFGDVKLASGYKVEACLASKTDINKAIAKHYSNQYAIKAVEDLEKETASKSVLVASNDNLNLNIDNAPSVKFVDAIIKNAIELRASDIHIEPFNDFVRVRYRIDGELKETVRASREIFNTLITRIKILANIDIAEKRLPLDGRILMRVYNQDVDLRVSSMPTIYGEKIVIRILGRKDAHLTIDRLGFTQEELYKVRRIIKNPHGILLVTGPTGSGKSTTLYTILKELNKVEKNIITIEDPVEYLIEGITQININSKIGFGFKEGLRSILRQDPDVIMLGEIRDDETASIAIKAAITGHLVLSTIHTNDAPSAVTRLIDMGVQPYLIAAALIGVVSQRLIRKLCLRCKKGYRPNSLEIAILGNVVEEGKELFNAEGCYFCNGTGYLGRVGIHEIMEITREHRDFIIAGKSVDELREICRSSGMHSLREACQRLVIEGITSVDEYSRLICEE